MMHRWLLVGCCLLIMGGCSNERVAEMQGMQVAPPYPELEEFDGGEHFMGIGYAAEGGRGGRPNWGEVRKLAKSDEYQAALSKLEASSVPSGYSSEKQALKEKIVTAGKNLSDGSNEETQATYQELLDSIREFRKVE